MAHKSPKVSVIIPCYNLGLYVEEAIDSVLNQTYQDFEIIVVNDGSTDDETNQILKNLKKDKTIIETIQNKGLAGARNHGISISKGEYICCLDADDKFDPRYLEKTVEVLDKDIKKEYGFVTVWLKHFGNEDWIWKSSDYDPIRLAVENIIVVSSLFRKEAFDKAGKYQKMYRAGYEDWNLWLSIVSAGYKWACIEEPLFLYRKRGESMINDASKYKEILYKEIVEKNEDFYKKNAIEIILKSYKTLSDSINYNSQLQAIVNHNEENVKWLNNQIKSLESGNAELKAYNEKLEKDTEDRIKDLTNELNSVKHQLEMTSRFKLLRLRNTIVHDRWNAKKILKIAYLTGGIITPEPLRKVLRKPIRKIIPLKRYLEKRQSEKIITQTVWPKELPLVSVVIPCFNYGEYVEEAIDSVLAQTFQNIEIIVVDGGSNDDSTVSILKNLKKDKTTIHFREGRHLVGDNRNFGINLAKGKYICCLDADDLLKPTYLEKALYILETQNFDIISCHTQMFGDKEQIYPVTTEVNLELMLLGNFINTAAVYKKSLWEKAGGYKDYGLGKEHIPEDWELWIKLLALGARATNVLEPLFLYRTHGISLSRHEEVPSYQEQVERIKSENANLITNESIQRSYRLRAMRYKVKNGTVNLLNNNFITNDKKRVLFMLPYTVAGGADKRYQQIMNLLLDNGFDISLITTLAFESIHFDTNEDYEKKIKNIFHLPRFLQDEKYWNDFILYFLESRKIEIMYQGSSAFVYDLFPTIKRLHPHLYIIDQQFNAIGHFPNNRKYAQYIDHTIAENNELKTLILDEYKEDPKKVTQIISGVDTSKLKRENYKKDRPEDLPKDKFLIMYIGRLSPEKGPDVFIEIANKLKNNDKYFFYIAGPGPEYDNCLKLIKKYDLKNIHLDGMVDGLKYMSWADILMVPSRIDGRPYAVLEGLSLGLPIIASNVGGLPDIIKDGENGLLCESENIEDFIEKINLLAEDGKLREKIMKNAREYAVNNFDIQIENKEYLKIFGKK